MVPMPPVFRPCQRPRVRLWSMLDTKGTTVFPSVRRASGDLRPVRNSMTIRLPGRAELPVPHDAFQRQRAARPRCPRSRSARPFAPAQGRPPPDDKRWNTWRAQAAALARVPLRKIVSWRNGDAAVLLHQVFEHPVAFQNGGGLIISFQRMPFPASVHSCPATRGSSGAIDT